MDKLIFVFFCCLLVQAEVIETPTYANLKSKENQKNCDDNEIFIFDGERTLILTHNKMARDLNHIQVKRSTKSFIFLCIFKEVEINFKGR